MEFLFKNDGTNNSHQYRMTEENYNGYTGCQLGQGIKKQESLNSKEHGLYQYQGRSINYRDFSYHEIGG